MITPGVMIRSLTFGPSMILILVDSSRSPESSGTRRGTVESIEASPRPRNIMASVAMNGWTSKYWMRIPETRPIVEPIAIITSTTSHALQPASASITPHTEDSAMIAPTERSMPPLMITKVSPTARMIRWALLMNRFEIVLSWKIRPYAVSP